MAPVLVTYWKRQFLAASITLMVRVRLPDVLPDVAGARRGELEGLRFNVEWRTYGYKKSFLCFFAF